MEASPDTPSEQLFAGKYKLIRQLGRGGMGTVFEALHVGLGQRVALKMLNPDVTRSAGRDAIERFRREARAAACLKSPHVARVTDIDEESDGTPFMVLEYLEGTDLARELIERKRLPVAEALEYVLQTCSAMDEAHAAGIVHRDLKPENLFLANDGLRRSVKVLDFGISKVSANDSVRVTYTLTALGTPLYMSPEQIRSAKDVDGRTDVWSLGVILYELISGCAPFYGATATAVIASITADEPVPLIEVCPEVPPELSEVVMRALEKSPKARWQTVREFALALEPFAAGVDFKPAEPISGTALAPALSQTPDDGAVTLLMQDGATTSRSAAETSARSKAPYLAVAAVIGAALLAFVAVTIVRSIRAEPQPASLVREQEKPQPVDTAPPTPTASSDRASGPPSVATPPRPKPSPRADRRPAAPKPSSASPSPAPTPTPGKAPEHPLAL